MSIQGKYYVKTFFSPWKLVLIGWPRQQECLKPGLVKFLKNGAELLQTLPYVYPNFLVLQKNFGLAFRTIMIWKKRNGQKELSLRIFLLISNNPTKAPQPPAKEIEAQKQHNVSLGLLVT